MAMQSSPDAMSQPSIRHVAARVDVDAVAVAAGRADDQVRIDDVARSWRDGYTTSIGTPPRILQPDVVTSDRLDEGRMPKWVLCRGSAAERRVADDFSRTDDANVTRVDRIEETDVAADPLALPPHLRDRVVSEVGCPGRSSCRARGEASCSIGGRGRRSGRCQAAPGRRRRRARRIDRAPAGWRQCLWSVPSPAAPKSRTLSIGLRGVARSRADACAANAACAADQGRGRSPAPTPERNVRRFGIILPRGAQCTSAPALISPGPWRL